MPPLAGQALREDRGAMRLGKVAARLLSPWRRRRAPDVLRVHTHTSARTPEHTPGAGGGGEENRSECLKIEPAWGALDSRIGGRRRARAVGLGVRRSAPRPHGRAGAG